MMFLKFCLMLLSLNYGMSIPIFFKKIQKNFSCKYWERSQENSDKTFLYIVGTAAFMETYIFRLKEHIVNERLFGYEDSYDEEHERVFNISDDHGPSPLSFLVQEMRKLRQNIKEFFYPHLDKIIKLEKKMKSYNKHPFIDEFNLLRLKTQDLDCLLGIWIRMKRPKKTKIYTYLNYPKVKKPKYDIQHISSHEVILLNKLAKKLDLFLSSDAIANIVKSFLNSEGTVAQQVKRDLIICS